MNHPTINPWTWQDALAFSQAVVVPGGERTVVLAGQGPVDADGRVLHPGDMDGQITAALDNVETVLAAAGMCLADVVRLNIYTTDVDRLFASYGTLAARLGAASCQAAGTLLGVTRLALPGMEIELEATASTGCPPGAGVRPV